MPVRAQGFLLFPALSATPTADLKAMHNIISRRTFLRQSALAAAGVWAAPALLRSARAASPNDVIHHASFGTTGMAATDIENLTKHPKLKLVAVADIGKSITRRS